MLETPQGVSRWTFRAGGWPIQIDLDETVLEMRVYMGRQVVATGRVAAAVMSALLGRTPIDTGGAVQADDCIAALREIIGDWRTRIQAAGGPPKPAVQSLYIDLAENADTPPQSIHLGFRSGISHLRAYLQSLQAIGINHVALNLRFNQADIDVTLRRLADELLPEFTV